MNSLFYKNFIGLFIIIIFYAFLALDAHAALTPYYGDTAPSNKIVSGPTDPANCTPYFNFGCNNGPTIGDPAGCGNTCTDGKVWTKYNFSGSCYNSVFQGDYVAWIDPIANSCSTADKYNDRYGSGDTTMLRAGGCACETKELFKTCCNGTNPIGTYSAGGNPQFPDGGCQYTTKPCGTDPSIYAALGYPYTGVACGAAACAGPATPTPTPTPPPVPGVCRLPGYSSDICKGNPFGAGGDCSDKPVNSTVSLPCTKTCSDGRVFNGTATSTCNQDHCYVNTCDCNISPQTCAAPAPTCYPGQTQTRCSDLNICPVP